MDFHAAAARVDGEDPSKSRPEGELKELVRVLVIPEKTARAASSAARAFATLDSILLSSGFAIGQHLRWRE